jgi:hypothetical protein
MASRPRKTPRAEIDVTSIWAYIASASIKDEHGKTSMLTTSAKAQL